MIIFHTNNYFVFYFAFGLCLSVFWHYVALLFVEYLLLSTLTHKCTYNERIMYIVNVLFFEVHCNEKKKCQIDAHLKKSQNSFSFLFLVKTKTHSIMLL